MAIQNVAAFVNSSPALSIKEVQDTYVQKNFQNLADYFKANNQLLNFGFKEIVFTAASANMLVAHGFAYPPVDIVVTSVSGSGAVSFNLGLFDNTNMNITATGACRVRFYFGRYWNATSTTNFAKTDAYVVSASGASPFSPIGTNGQVLVADSTSAQGASWKNPTDAGPIGSVIAFAGVTAPTGYLSCDGRTISRTTYSDLFKVIGTTYGAGDNSTTFQIPNLGGIFPSGAGTQVINSTTFTRALGAKQGYNVGDHFHYIHTYGIQGYYAGAINMQSLTNFGLGDFGDSYSTESLNHNFGNPAENYPANLALNYCIKFSNPVSSVVSASTAANQAKRPAFSCDLNSQPTIAPNNNLPYDTLLVDTFGGWNPVNHYYQIPVGWGGAWRVSTISHSPTNGGDILVINGAINFCLGYSGGSLSVEGTTKIINVKENDKISIWTDTTRFFYGSPSGDGGYTNFSLEYVG